MEDRIITTDELRYQAALGLKRADVLLPAGVDELLEAPAFHVVAPTGRACIGDYEKLVVQLVLDTTEGQIRVDVIVDDEWFVSLPTSFQVLCNVCHLVAEAVQRELIAPDGELF